MYIAIESYSEEDPRLVPEMEFNDFLNWAIFNFVYIKPENVSKVDFSNINYVELTEDQWNAVKFLKANDEYKLSIAKDSTIHNELEILGSLEDHEYKPKSTYSLSETDKTKLLELYKIMMRLYLNHHYNNLSSYEQDFNQSVRASLENEILSVNNLETARVLLHTKFGIATSSQLTERNNLGSPQVRLSNRMHSA